MTVMKDKIKKELEHRAGRGAATLRFYPGYLELSGPLVDEDFETCLTDLITDLMHLAKIKWNFDPAEIIRMAIHHFEAEQAGNP